MMILEGAVSIEGETMTMKESRVVLLLSLNLVLRGPRFPLLAGFNARPNCSLGGGLDFRTSRNNRDHASSVTLKSLIFFQRVSLQ
jgi:hypothetical protein